MLEYYAEIRAVHVGAVLASGALFLVRGVAVQRGAAWAMAAPARRLSYGVDTVLLVAALLLVAVLPGAVFANGWLAVKLGLLPVYVALGSFALKRARTPRARLACFLGALATYGFMITIARVHHPLGALRALLLD